MWWSVPLPHVEETVGSIPTQGFPLLTDFHKSKPEGACDDKWHR